MAGSTTDIRVRNGPVILSLSKRVYRVVSSDTRSDRAQLSEDDD